MPIVASNLLAPDMMVDMAIAPGASRNMRQMAVVKKAMLLLNENGNDLVRFFMGPQAQSVIMQQEFDDQDMLLALVTAEGDVTGIRRDGSEVQDMAFSGTVREFQETWQTTGPAREGEHKVGLLVASADWQEFIDHHDQEQTDTRFNPALQKLQQIKDRQLVPVGI
jgi:hypothetical protein